MTPPTLSIWISGLPQTAGSKRAFPIRVGGILTGRMAVVDDNPKSKDWKVRVAAAGEQAMITERLQAGLFKGPLAVAFTFHMPRIGAHFRASGELKPGAPIWPIVRPDCLKMARAAEDSLSKVVYCDDSQIVIERLEKRYSAKPGLLIELYELSNEPAPKLEAMELRLEGV